MTTILSDDPHSIAEDQPYGPSGWSLGTRTGIALYITLTIAIGTTTTGALWIAGNSLRQQAEQNGRRTAATLAGELEALASNSAANTTRTLDVVMEDQLRATAAAAAMLVEAAEAARHTAPYIEDALRQLTARSPIRRIDVAADEGPSYSTERNALDIAELPEPYRELARTAPEGRTATMPARTTPEGLSKTAASQTLHRRLALQVRQNLDQQDAETAYGRPGSLAARRLASDQAAAIALIIAHAIELAEDADWTAREIQARLDAIVRNTSIVRIQALGGAGTIVYTAPATTTAARTDTGATADERTAQAAVTALIAANQTATTDLAGHFDDQRRWIAGAAALRTRGRLAASVQLATQAGEGSLVESAWQTAADQFGRVPGITGLWITTTDAGRTEPRLAAAAPRPGETSGDATDAWSRGSPAITRTANRSATANSAVATADVDLWRGTPAAVLSAAPIGRDATIVVQTEVNDMVRRMRSEIRLGIATAVGLIAIMTLATTWSTRRWLTSPVIAIADRARMLASGDRPPPMRARLAERSDELGTLARSFDHMTEEVLARHDELARLVADRTHSLKRTVDRLKATNDQIEHDVRLGRIVQKNLVPAGTQNLDQLELHARMSPAQDLGGDFVILQRTGPQTLMAGVFDVSGKGVAAALFMVAAQAALNAAAREHSNVADVARTANTTLCASNELSMFVTGFLASFNTVTGHFDYVCAGHEPPIARRGPTLEKLPPTGNLPLALEPEHAYNTAAGELEPGDAIVMYTDGVTDAANKTGDDFGEQRLRKIVATTTPPDPPAIVDRIWFAIDEFSGDADAVDDMTCLAIRRTPAAEGG